MGEHFNPPGGAECGHLSFSVDPLPPTNDKQMKMDE